MVTQLFKEKNIRKTMRCKEHELFIIEERYVSDDKVEATIECSLCNVKFKGILKKS